MMSKPRILVVDDAPDIRELVAALLPADEFEVTGVPDGIEALRLVAEQPPELIVLDVTMPGMDGVAVCRQIKGTPPTRDIPVLLLTAHAEFEARSKGEEAHADAFLTKPFSPFTLLRTIEHLLEVASARRRTQR